MTSTATARFSALGNKMVTNQARLMSRKTCTAWVKVCKGTRTGEEYYAAKQWGRSRTGGRPKAYSVLIGFSGNRDRLCAPLSGIAHGCGDHFGHLHRRGNDLSPLPSRLCQVSVPTKSQAPTITARSLLKSWMTAHLTASSDQKSSDGFKGYVLLCANE